MFDFSSFWGLLYICDVIITLILKDSLKWNYVLQNTLDGFISSLFSFLKHFWCNYYFIFQDLFMQHHVLGNALNGFIFLLFSFSKYFWCNNCFIFQDLFMQYQVLGNALNGLTYSLFFSHSQLNYHYFLFDNNLYIIKKSQTFQKNEKLKMQNKK